MSQSIQHHGKNRNTRGLYVVLSIMIMLCLGTVYSYSVFRISIEKIFNVGSAESGMPYMTALAFYALFMMLTGRILDRFHPRQILFVGGALVSTGWILSSFAPNIVLLTITYGCISGAGVGIAYGVPMKVIAKWFPEKKGLAVGMILIGFGLSPLITAPLARQLVEAYGVMTAFLILGIGFGIILPILSFSFKYPDVIDEEIILEQKKHIATKEMLRTKNFKGLYLNFMVGTMIGLMMIGMTTSVGIEFAGIEPHKVIPLMSLFAVFNGLGRPIFGWITDQLSPKKAMLISYSLIISSALMLVGLGENKPWIYVISFSIFWFNLGGWLAIAPAATLKLYGMKHYSQNYGLLFTAYGLGAIAGVSTSGLLLDLHESYYFVFYYVIILCLMGILSTVKLINHD